MARARNPDLIEAFRDVLRAARKSEGLSQEELALLCDVDRTFVGLLEAGKRQPTLSVVYALARGLNTTPQKMMDAIDLRMAVVR